MPLHQVDDDEDSPAETTAHLCGSCCSGSYLNLCLLQGGMMWRAMQRVTVLSAVLQEDDDEGDLAETGSRKRRSYGAGGRSAKRARGVHGYANGDDEDDSDNGPIRHRGERPASVLTLLEYSDEVMAAQIGMTGAIQEEKSPDTRLNQASLISMLKEWGNLSVCWLCSDTHWRGGVPVSCAEIHHVFVGRSHIHLHAICMR